MRNAFGLMLASVVAAVVIAGTIKLAWTGGARESTSPIATHLRFGPSWVALEGSF